MRTRPTTWILLALVIAIPLWTWQHFSDPSRQVRVRLVALSKLVAKDGPEAPLALADKARQLNGFFAPDFVVDLPPVGQRLAGDVGQLMRYLAGYRAGPSRLTVGYRDLDIQLGAGGRIATSTFVVVATGFWEGSVQPSRNAYRFRVRWVQQDGSWVIESAEMLEIVSGDLLF
ncbi:MAG: nuclear transport factor 2 family protein [Acidobacteriota bacterium]